jgi:hypothetical protein
MVMGQIAVGSRNLDRYTLAAGSGDTRSEAGTWARLAVVSGFVAGGTYATFAATELPLLVAVVFVCAFGPALALNSAGLYEALRLHRSTVSVKIALGANLAAAIAVTMGLLAQVGYREWLDLKFGSDPIAGTASPAYQAANGLQLGFDFAWDLFLVIGTFLLAMNMWSHPRYGRSFAVSGMAIASTLLVFNIATFPEPPADAHLFDPGPLIGVWYVVVTIRLALSLKWVRDNI